MSDTQQTTAKTTANIGDYIGTTLWVSLTDNRILKGILLATDNVPNILLENVLETTANRELGMVTVPGNCIRGVHMARREHNLLMEYRENK